MTDVLETGRQIAHYRLVARLGEGGMGVVWKAQDLDLDRPVALKFLPPEAESDPGRRRMFLDEARLASSLSDARIAQIHELGHAAGRDFIAMEFVEGRSLDRMLRGRPLPLETATELGLQVAQAIARAHHRNLLHRDIKPANVIVTPEGEAKLVDFGLAALLRVPEPGDPSAADRSASRPRIQPGEFAGTLAYMSPEQLRGEPLDARSDIHAIGVVLYEMITGCRPFAGDTEWELAQQILAGQPRPPRERVARIPAELERIVLKALAPKPADRYQTVDDLAVDLKSLEKALASPGLRPARHRRRALAWAVGAMAVAAALVAWRLTPGRAGPLDPHRLVVMPLEVRGQTEGAQYLGRIFRDAIAIDLASARGLTVLPGAARAPSEEPVRSGTTAARRAHAGRCLVGLIVRTRDSLAVSVSLLDSGRGNLLWGAYLTSHERDLSACASGIARAVSRTLAVGVGKQYGYVGDLTGSAAMASSPRLPLALAAVRAYDLAACDSLARSLCVEFPGDPDAHVLRIWAMLGLRYTRPIAGGQAAFEGEMAALRALDPGHPYLQIARAIEARIGGRYAEAIRILDGVSERDDLTPAARSHVLRQKSVAYSLWGRNESAIQVAGEALRLEPTLPQGYEQLSNVLAQGGRFSDALLRAREGLAISPGHVPLNHLAGYCLMELGRLDEAIAPMRSACELAAAQTECADFAVVLQRAGRPAEAREAAREASDLPATPYGQYNLAQYWALAGDHRASIRCLRTALDMGFADVDLLSQRHLDAIRGDPAFQPLAAEVRRRLSAR